jgi:diguanylate cyclase (GGDEF)-like protein
VSRLKGLHRPTTATRAESTTGLADVSVEQLQVELTRQRAGRRQLEREVGSLRARLAEARTELVGTQAGEHQARHLALHDSLTSLPNRRYFLQRLDHALAHVERRRSTVAILYLDLDAFKPINDTHGHQTGDEVLKIVAARLARAVRENDMMSRLGGDEFACLPAAVLTWEQLGHMAHKLIAVVSAPLTIGTLTFAVHPSIGIATYPTDGTTAEDLIKSADDAMYRSKRDRLGYSFVDRRPAQIGLDAPRHHQVLSLS